MKRTCLIFSRELKNNLVSPIAYVVAAIFVSGVSSTFLYVAWLHEGGDEPFAGLLLAATMIWLPILVTAMTMRSFAEERRSGTIEGLLTAPVEDAEVVAGKFLSAWFLCSAVVLLPVVNALWLARMSRGIASVDGGALLAVVFYICLVLAAFCAVGVLASLCSRSQSVAAILCMGALAVPLFAGVLFGVLPSVPDAVVYHVSVEEQMAMVARGAIGLDVVVLYASVCAGALFAAVRLLEARRWVK